MVLTLDLRVESDGNANMLFVDGGANKVGIGTNSLGRVFNVYDPASDGAIKLETGGNASNIWAGIEFKTPSAQSFIYVPSNDSTGLIKFLPAASEVLALSNSAVVVNETGSNVDFRVESAANANMLVVDASTNRVGVGVAAPLQTLHVSGSTFASGYYITVLQGNAQLTNASTSSGSNPSYIGQGLISVTVSDAKAKENFGPVEENECLNKVVSLAEHVKKFDWIDEDWKKEKGRTVGMVAQEVYEDHSEFVHKPENYNDGGWAIRHQEMVPTLIKAIQEQQELIKTLEARISGTRIINCH